MSPLYYDGDVQRIYEVPAPPFTFATDGGGYRVYTPVGAGESDTFASVIELWSGWVDYHNSNQWSLLAFERSGGTFRIRDALGVDTFAPTDLRLINGWEIVPANYPHNFTLLGNIYPNDADRTFDVDRLTVQGVSPRVEFQSRGERAIVDTGSGLSPEQASTLERILALLESDEYLPPATPTGANTAEKRDRVTKQPILQKRIFEDPDGTIRLEE